MSKSRYEGELKRAKSYLKSIESGVRLYEWIGSKMRDVTEETREGQKHRIGWLTRRIAAES